jgi:hypothetical protein
VQGTFVFDVPSVERRDRLKKHNPAFCLRHWTMFHTARYHDKLALFNPFVAVAKVHAEAAFDYEEHLVFVLMMMKYEGAVQLDELDVLSVELGGDARLVVIGDLGEFFCNVYFGHEGLKLLDGPQLTSDAEKFAGFEKKAELRSAGLARTPVPHEQKQSRQLFADG